MAANIRSPVKLWLVMIRVRISWSRNQRGRMSEATQPATRLPNGTALTGVSLHHVLVAIFAVPAGLTILGLGARWWWPLELCTHFTAHYFIALLAGTAFSAWFKFKKAAIVFGAVALYNFALIAPLYWPVAAPLNAPKSDRTVRVMTANVFLRNTDHDRFLEIVRETSPDVLVVLELTSQWLASLEALDADYPHRVARPRGGSFGIGMWSRLPPDELELREIGPAEVPSIYARFDVAGRRLYVIGSHSLPPVSAEHSTLRNAQLHALAELAASLDGPVVMLGDFNITSWSPMFHDMLAVSKLRDSRRGFGIQATWPSELCPFGIAIDHVLVSPEVAVRRRTIGRDIGSDHRPVVVDLIVPPSDRNAR
jgi:endonuclease/exonuclease/phosphatase (EEP) superfamily protein YafD